MRPSEKAEQTGAYGQGPSKKGTANPVARTSAKFEAASSSTSASVWLDRPQQSSGSQQKTVTLVNGRSGTGAGTKR